MISFPNAKINLGLNIIEKRSDGFHNIISCFYPVQWTDILEVIPSNKTSFEYSGLNIPGDPSENLCLKAVQLLSDDFEIPPVKIYLHKIIPIGAGLGGGSADAAFTLKTINQLFNLNLNHPQLESYAKKLGSDCAFFINNQPTLAHEKGDRFEDIHVDLKGKYLFLINPNIHISTQEAYAGITPSLPSVSIKQIIEDHPITEWKDLLKNDFEIPIFSKKKDVAVIKDQLYDCGAIYASMTGSGSSIYGIFEEKPSIERYFPKCKTWKGML